MDEAKRKELEELRKQIRPDILEKVAKALDGGGGGGGGGASSSTSAPSRSSGGGRWGGGSGGSMSDLQRRIARREKDWDAWEKQQNEATPEKKKQQKELPGANLTEHFVVFDTNMMNGRAMASYLKRMEFTKFSYAGDPQRFLEAYLNMTNNSEIRHPAIVTSPDAEPVVKVLLNSEQMVKIRSRLPNMGVIATFVFYEDDRELSKLQSVDPRYVLNVKHDPMFNRKRMSQILEVLHTINPE